MRIVDSIFDFIERHIEKIVFGLIGLADLFFLYCCIIWKYRFLVVIMIVFFLSLILFWILGRAGHEHD